jgi:hypothetical protein
MSEPTIHATDCVQAVRYSETASKKTQNLDPAEIATISVANSEDVSFLTLWSATPLMDGPVDENKNKALTKGSPYGHGQDWYRRTP